MSPFKAADMMLDAILGILISKAAELKGEKLEGFMFAVRIVQVFKRVGWNHG